MITDLFNTLRNTASSNDRKQIMTEALQGPDRELIIQIFNDCYGPAKYGVRSDRVCTQGTLFGQTYTIDDNYDEFHQLLIKLSTRELTGNAALRATEELLNNFLPEDRVYLCMILDKNLKVGFSLEQVNLLVGKERREFSCSLAYNLDKVKGVNPVDGNYFASRKLDGCRCLCFVHSELCNGETIVDDPIFISRQGKEFTTLHRLKNPVKKLIAGYHFVGDIVLDGEVCILDENGDEHFDWIMKEIRRKDHTIQNPCYNIFDVLSRDEFEGRVESPDFSTRNFYLMNAFHHLYQTYGRQKELKLLQQERLESQEDFDRWTNYVTEGHWEGFMLRKDVPYQSGRTKDLLKVKKFQDAEYVVQGLTVGQFKYNTETIDGVAAIQITHKGNPVSVGSGISREQREDWLHHPEHIIGKTVTIQYFEETKDRNGSYSLRFPVLKYVYEDGRNT